VAAAVDSSPNFGIKRSFLLVILTFFLTVRRRSENPYFSGADVNAFISRFSTNRVAGLE